MTESAPTRTTLESSGRHRAVGPVGRRDRSGRRLRVISLVGLGVGLLLLAVPYGSTALRTLVWGGDPEPQVGVPAAAASPVAPAPPVSTGPTPSVTAPSGTPGASATPTPTATPRTPGSPTPGATEPAPPVQGATAPTTPAGTSPPPAPAPPQPVLLGPDGSAEVAEMMDRYCDRHVGGSWADARGDGGWECERLLLPSHPVDVDRACRDTYGAGAFAENPAGRDPYGWRCFRL